MRIYNKYIASLVLVSCLVNTLLAFLSQNQLEIYFVINIIAYLVITELYVYLNPRSRRALSRVGAALFAGFMAIVAIKVVEILSRR